MSCCEANTKRTLYSEPHAGCQGFAEWGKKKTLDGSHRLHDQIGSILYKHETMERNYGNRN